jgi:TPR repeat protein
LAQQGDLDEAEALLRKMADVGQHETEVNLRMVFMRRGDLEQAERWLRKAADASHHQAETNLGVLLMQKEDLEQAEGWLRKAADAGVHQAEINLGILLMARANSTKPRRYCAGPLTSAIMKRKCPHRHYRHYRPSGGTHRGTDAVTGMAALMAVWRQ